MGKGLGIFSGIGRRYLGSGIEVYMNDWIMNMGWTIWNENGIGWDMKGRDASAKSYLELKLKSIASSYLCI
jgi:hypothetical protein